MGFHVGNKIIEILKQRHKTKQDLGRALGLSASSATYITSRESIDADTLQKIGIALQYNFFKHYPVMELNAPVVTDAADAADTEKKTLQDKITALEKEVEDCKRDLMMLKQENVYLKKINDLLEKR
jgi:transcriptional regulator with XRE-family HTH domain